MRVNIVYMYSPTPARKTANRSPANPAPVISVRVDRSTLDALDELTKRTGRSRGFYLREAIAEQLPLILERYWSDTSSGQSPEDRTFLEILKRNLLEF